MSTFLTCPFVELETLYKKSNNPMQNTLIQSRIQWVIHFQVSPPSRLRIEPRIHGFEGKHPSRSATELAFNNFPDNFHWGTWDSLNFLFGNSIQHWNFFKVYNYFTVDWYILIQIKFQIMFQRIKNNKLSHGKKLIV